MSVETLMATAYVLFFGAMIGMVLLDLYYFRYLTRPDIAMPNYYNKNIPPAYTSRRMLLLCGPVSLAGMSILLIGRAPPPEAPYIVYLSPPLSLFFFFLHWWALATAARWCKKQETDPDKDAYYWATHDHYE